MGLSPFLFFFSNELPNIGRITLASNQKLLIITKDWLLAGMKLVVALLKLLPESLPILIPITMQFLSAERVIAGTDCGYSTFAGLEL